MWQSKRLFLQNGVSEAWLLRLTQVLAVGQLSILIGTNFESPQWIWGSDLEVSRIIIRKAVRSYRGIRCTLKM